MDDDLSHRDTAIRALGADRHDTAADSYARAAYAELAGLQGRRRDVYDAETATWVGYPLGAFFLAAVCHRVDGVDGRARNRAGQGIMVAGDHRNHLLDDPVAEAACHEWVGDFRTAAGDDDKARAAYDRAESGYEEAAPDDPSRGPRSRSCRPVPTASSSSPGRTTSSGTTSTAPHPSRH